jgi:predicted nucleic acid-binding protein
LFFYEFKPIFSNGVELKYKTRDVSDDRILNSAIINKMDVLLTGDSDYYGYRGSKTKVMNPRELAELISHN